jgi:hypothetical protein
MLKKALSQKPQAPAPAAPAITRTQAPADADSAGVDQEEIRLAICVPCREMIHAVFSHNLHSLLNYNWQKGIDTKVFYNMSTLLSNQRESLVSAARSWAATHILWLDSDMSFPFYTAYKLLDHDQPIVAANYTTRQMPYKTVAYTELGGEWNQYLKHNKEVPITKELIEVKGIGMGCMLTDITVFDKLTRPYFPVTWSPESEDYLGEDINFCTAAQAAGYKIEVDDILSRQLSHIGAFAFGHDLVKD